MSLLRVSNKQETRLRDPCKGFVPNISAKRLSSGIVLSFSVGLQTDAL